MKLFFRKYGEGKPLIILHGLFGTADNWNTLGKKFGEHFTTYLVDQRNHGQSPHSEEWNYDVMVEDLRELMDDEGLEMAHITGHSMGGKTAMFFSMKYPDRVDKLIISDIAPRYYSVHHQELIDAMLSVDLAAMQSRKQVEEIIAEKIPDTGTRQFLLKNLYWKGEQLAWRFNLDVISRNIEEVGKAIPENEIYDGPTLFIRGGKSDYISDEDWEDIQSFYPNSELETIDSGHWVHAEKPEEYYYEVMRFLKDDN